ncbi:MAG: sigma-70 family RNA polymerase sigma factor, partial [Actinomycetota bacterium]
MLDKGEKPQRKDRDLLSRIGKGDDRAFSALYERYSPAALGLAIRICGDRALAEDVVQEAFLSIWKRPGSYTSERGSIAAYVMGAVHHKAVDAIRKEESLRRRERAVSDSSETAEDDLEEEGWLAVMRSEVRSAVERLSPLQREALDLAYFEGLTYSEVAEKLRIPLGTAKTRLRDGMLRLRDVLADTG